MKNSGMRMVNFVFSSGPIFIEHSGRVSSKLILRALM